MTEAAWNPYCWDLVDVQTQKVIMSGRGHEIGHLNYLPMVWIDIWADEQGLHRESTFIEMKPGWAMRSEWKPLS
jgi:hypothetical protein